MPYASRVRSDGIDDCDFEAVLHRVNELIRSPRAKALLPGLLFVLLVVTVYADPLFFHRVFEGRDPIGYNYPIEKAVHDAWARGHLPVWISEISGGRPLLGNPNVGAFYPVRPLAALFSFPLAIRIFPILHWAIAGLGMLRLLRIFGVSRSGAWLGAVTFVFCGVSVSDVCYPNTQPGMALLPWIVAETAAPQWTARSRTVVLGALFGLYGLIGDAFSIVLAAAGCVLWILSELPRKEWTRRFLVIAAALPLAVLVAAPQIVASAAWIPQTNRAVLGLKLGEVLLFSLSPWRLLEFVVPFPFGPTWTLDNSRSWGWKLFGLKSVGFYSSLYAGALGAIAVVSIRKVRAPGARFARALLVFGLVASVLPSFAPGAWRNVSSPLPLRFPEKFAVSLVLAVAITVGIAVDDLRRRSRMPRWPLAVGGVLAILALAAFVFPAASGRAAVGLIGADSFLAQRAARELASALCEGGLLWMATVVALELWPREANLRAVLALAVLTAVPIVGHAEDRGDLLGGRGSRTDCVCPRASTAPTLPGSFGSSERRRTERTRSSRSSISHPILRRATPRAGAGANTRELSGDAAPSSISTSTPEIFPGWKVSGTSPPSRLRTRTPRHSSRLSACASGSGTGTGTRFRVSGDADLGIEVWDENPAALPTIRLATSWHEVVSPVEALRLVPGRPRRDRDRVGRRRLRARRGAGTVRDRRGESRADDRRDRGAGPDVALRAPRLLDRTAGSRRRTGDEPTRRRSSRSRPCPYPPAITGSNGTSS